MWITESAGRQGAVSTLLASRHHVHGGPVLETREGLCSRGPGRGGSGFPGWLRLRPSWHWESPILLENCWALAAFQNAPHHDSPEPWTRLP